MSHVRQTSTLNLRQARRRFRPNTSFNPTAKKLRCWFSRYARRRVNSSVRPGDEGEVHRFRHRVQEDLQVLGDDLVEHGVLGVSGPVDRSLEGHGPQAG